MSYRHLAISGFRDDSILAHLDKYASRIRLRDKGELKC